MLKSSGHVKQMILFICKPHEPRLVLPRPFVLRDTPTKAT